jgi:hypothetical protein
MLRSLNPDPIDAISIHAYGEDAERIVWAVTTSRFGSGFTTSQSSGRGGAGVLVVPGSVRCR